MLFKDIPGLTESKGNLIGAVQENHLAHARLFVGPKGALALPLALANATYIHCERRGEHDACGQCAACLKSLKYIHPDTHFVFPVGNIKGSKDEEEFKADMLKVWRSFLREQPFGTLDDWVIAHDSEDKQPIITRNESRQIIRLLSLKPFESHSKVMIIWHVELMHPSAANGILKILEEPAPNTYFILVSDTPGSLLPTITSRTQVVSVPLLHDEDIVQFLAAAGISASTAKRVARLSGGSISQALTLVEEEEDESAALFVKWMRTCFRKKYDALVALADEFHHLDRLSQKNLMIYALHAYRESLLHLFHVEPLQQAQDDELKFIGDFSKVMTLEVLERSQHLVNEAAYHLDRNGSAKMIFLDLSLNLANTINPRG